MERGSCEMQHGVPLDRVYVYDLSREEYLQIGKTAAGCRIDCWKAIPMAMKRHHTSAQGV